MLAPTHPSQPEARHYMFNTDSHFSGFGGLKCLEGLNVICCLRLRANGHNELAVGAVSGTFWHSNSAWCDLRPINPSRSRITGQQSVQPQPSSPDPFHSRDVRVNGSARSSITSGPPGVAAQLLLMGAAATADSVCVPPKLRCDLSSDTHSVSPATCPTLFSRTQIKPVWKQPAQTMQPCLQVRMCSSWRNGFQVAASHGNVIRLRHLPDRSVLTEKARAFSRQGETCNELRNTFMRSVEV